jgi:hypothetical protein
MQTPSPWTWIAGVAVILALSACSAQPIPNQGVQGNSGGGGGMAYPAPLPQGQLTTTPVR